MCRLPFSSGGAATRHVRPVLWIISCGPIKWALYGDVTLPQQLRCNAVHGIIPLLHGIGCVLFYTTAGAKARRVLRARGATLSNEANLNN